MRVLAASLFFFAISLVSTGQSEAQQGWLPVSSTSGPINTALFASCEYRLAMYPVTAGSTDARFFSLTSAQKPGASANAARLRTAVLPFKDLQDLPSSLLPVTNPPIVTSGSSFFLAIVPINNSPGYKTELWLTGPNRPYNINQSSSSHLLSLESRCQPSGIVLSGALQSGVFAGSPSWGTNVSFELAVPVGTCVQFRCSFGGYSSFANLATVTNQPHGTPQGCSSSPPYPGQPHVFCSFNGSAARTCSCVHSLPSGVPPPSGPVPPMNIDVVQVHPSPQVLLGSRSFTLP